MPVQIPFKYPSADFNAQSPGPRSAALAMSPVAESAHPATAVSKPNMFSSPAKWNSTGGIVIPSHTVALEPKPTEMAPPPSLTAAATSRFPNPTGVVGAGLATKVMAGSRNSDSDAVVKYLLTPPRSVLSASSPAMARVPQSPSTRLDPAPLSLSGTVPASPKSPVASPRSRVGHEGHDMPSSSSYTPSKTILSDTARFSAHQVAKYNDAVSQFDNALKSLRQDVGSEKWFKEKEHASIQGSPSTVRPPGSLLPSSTKTNSPIDQSMQLDEFTDVANSSTADFDRSRALASTQGDIHLYADPRSATKSQQNRDVLDGFSASESDSEAEVALVTRDPEAVLFREDDLFQKYLDKRNKELGEVSAEIDLIHRFGRGDGSPARTRRAQESGVSDLSFQYKFSDVVKPDSSHRSLRAGSLSPTSPAKNRFHADGSPRRPPGTGYSLPRPKELIETRIEVDMPGRTTSPRRPVSRSPDRFVPKGAKSVKTEKMLENLTLNLQRAHEEIEARQRNEGIQNRDTSPQKERSPAASTLRYIEEREARVHSPSSGSALLHHYSPEHAEQLDEAEYKQAMQRRLKETQENIQKQNENEELAMRYRFAENQRRAISPTRDEEKQIEERKAELRQSLERRASAEEPLSSVDPEQVYRAMSTHGSDVHSPVWERRRSLESNTRSETHRSSMESNAASDPRRQSMGSNPEAVSQLEEIRMRQDEQAALISQQIAAQQQALENQQLQIEAAQREKDRQEMERQQKAEAERSRVMNVQLLDEEIARRERELASMLTGDGQQGTRSSGASGTSAKTGSAGGSEAVENRASFWGSFGGGEEAPEMAQHQPSRASDPAKAQHLQSEQSFNGGHVRDNRAMTAPAHQHRQSQDSEVSQAQIVRPGAVSTFARPQGNEHSPMMGIQLNDGPPPEEVDPSELYMGAKFMKYPQNGTGVPRKCMVKLKRDKSGNLTVFWSHNGNRWKGGSHMPLTSTTRILYGPRTLAFTARTARTFNDWLCLSIVGSGRSLDLVAFNDVQVRTWLFGLRQIGVNNIPSAQTRSSFNWERARLKVRDTSRRKSQSQAKTVVEAIMQAEYQQEGQRSGSYPQQYMRNSGQVLAELPHTPSTSHQSPVRRNVSFMK